MYSKSRSLHLTVGKPLLSSLGKNKLQEFKNNPPHDLGCEVELLPNTTQGKIALIAQGTPNSWEAPNFERISQLLNATFDANDYMDVLRKYPDPQQYVDDLYKVNYPYFVKFPFTYPFRYL